MYFEEKHLFLPNIAEPVHYAIFSFSCQKLTMACLQRPGGPKTGLRDQLHKHLCQLPCDSETCHHPATEATGLAVNGKTK